MDLICVLANGELARVQRRARRSRPSPPPRVRDEPSARNTYGSWGRRMCANTNFGPGAVETRGELAQLEQRALAVPVEERELGRRPAEHAVDGRHDRGVVEDRLELARGAQHEVLIRDRDRPRRPEPGAQLVVAVALALEELADRVVLEHRLRRRPVARVRADRLGELVQVAHVERRGEREVGRPVVGVAVGRHLEASAAQPVVQVVALDAEPAVDRLRRPVSVEDQEVDVARRARGRVGEDRRREGDRAAAPRDAARTGRSRSRRSRPARPRTRSVPRSPRAASRAPGSRTRAPPRSPRPTARAARGRRGRWRPGRRRRGRRRRTPRRPPSRRSRRAGHRAGPPRTRPTPGRPPRSPGPAAPTHRPGARARGWPRTGTGSRTPRTAAGRRGSRLRRDIAHHRLGSPVVITRS